MQLREFKAICASPEEPEKVKIANVKLNFDDGIAEYIAGFYDQDAGASSIKQAAESKVFDKVNRSYMEGEIKGGTEAWLSLQTNSSAKFVRVSKTNPNSVPKRFSSKEEVEETEEDVEDESYVDKRPTFE